MQAPNQGQTTIGKLFERIIIHCGSDMQEEQQCDARNENTNPAACARFIQASDDCYEKVICPTEWKIKSDCAKKNPNNPEACTSAVQASQNCKRNFFQTVMPAPVVSYIQKMTAIGQDCQATMAKYAELAEKHGESHPLALDAEFAHVRCMWSRMLPKSIWTDFENCYTKSKNDRSKCQVEIEQIQLALHKEGEMVTRAMGFVPQTDYRRYGGPAAILQNLVAPVMYSAHVDDLLTDAINKQSQPSNTNKK